MAKDGAISGVTGAPRWLIVVSVSLVVALAGALGIVRATNDRFDDVARDAAVTAVLSPASETVENFLIVGSDSRASADPSDPDYEVVGSESANPGRRSDSLIVARVDRSTGGVATMSIPRDLWVEIGDTGRQNKINSAYQRGNDTVVRTVQRALNVPIHHFVEIDFGGFKRIVDAIGGVTVCVPHRARDKTIGLFVPRKGCHRFDGVTALRYVRSRHYEEKYDGTWHLEGTGDVGRGARQRTFMSALVKDSIRHLARHPMESGRVIDSFTGAVRIDGGLDLLDMARKLRPLGAGGSDTWSLPVSSDMSSGTFVFRMDRDAQPLLAYFAGLGPAPSTDADG